MMNWNQIMFQDSSSTSMNMLIHFHDLILITMTMVLSVVAYMFLFLFMNKFTNRMIKEAHKVEIIWTIIPSIILMSLAVPSLHLLYIMDESNEPSITVKIIGSQWYWTYEYSEFPYINFNSFMIPDHMLNEANIYRLLETESRMILPINTNIRLLVTASDVIHSWTIPSMGVKVDAIPGRLNQLNFTINRLGIFYGQCSEICGANHSFMPITLESHLMENFIQWMKTYHN